MDKTKPQRDLTEVIVVDGQEIYFYLPDAEDHIQKTIRRDSAFYESAMLADIRSRFLESGVAIDVGANIGNHTLYMAALCNLQVVAIEPCVQSFEILRQNVALNHLEHLTTLIAKAAGASRSQGNVITPDQHNIGTSYVNLAPDGAVDVFPLDTLEVENVVLIKIDVEGMELDVLRGATQLLSKYSPALYIEAHNEEKLTQIRAFLNPYGYFSVRSFNVTPTLLFLPAHTEADRMVIINEMLDSMRFQIYGLSDHQYSQDKTHGVLIENLNAHKQSIHDLQSQVRALGTQADQNINRLHQESIQTRQDLVTVLQQLGEVASSVQLVPELDASLTKYDRRITHLEHRVEALTQQTDHRINRFHQESEQTQQDLANVTQTLAELASFVQDVLVFGNSLPAYDRRLAQLERTVSDDLAQARRQARDREEALIKLRREYDKTVFNFGEILRSRSFRLGRTLAELTKNPARNIPKLPGAILKALREHPNNMAQPTLSAPPAPRIERPSASPVAVTAQEERVVTTIDRTIDVTDQKVTVIMTTFNSADYVKEAIDSILNQTHKNLELLIVDDCSTDDTFDVLTRIAQEDERVRPVKSFVNHGTYWCKNLGLTLAASPYVTFQDSDDISEPTRIEAQLQCVRGGKGIVASTCNYVRQDETGAIVANRGLRERRALISLLFDKATVLQRMGYFDSVRTSADDEFLERMKLLYSENKVAHIDQVLYIARVRRDSLTQAIPSRLESGILDHSLSFLSEARRSYVECYQAWHQDIARALQQPYIAFPLLHRPFNAPPELLPISDIQTEYISASMATIPSRFAMLHQVIDSILPQVDQLNIYLNNFEEVPTFLKHDKIRIARSQQHGDIRDSGKLFFIDQLPSGYHFTIDDDIIYPPDYVQHHILKIEQYERRAIVGIHGVILASPLQRFFEDRTVFHFKESLAKDTCVNLIGTATAAYHTSTISLSFNDVKFHGMADLWLAVQAKRQRIPMICTARRSAFLLPTSQPDTSADLYMEFKENDERQTKVAKEEGTWELPANLSIYRPIAESLLQRFSPAELRSRDVDVDFLSSAKG